MQPFPWLIDHRFIQIILVPTCNDPLGSIIQSQLAKQYFPAHTVFFSLELHISSRRA